MNPSAEIAERLIRSVHVSTKTPRYVFFPDVLDRRLKEVSEGAVSHDVFYSLKANPAPEVLSRIAAHGFGADVSSLWELNTAVQAGFAPGKITCVGPWKSEEFLRAAVDLGVRRICCENDQEYRWLHSNGRSTEIYARVLLPDEVGDVAERMALPNSPFGLLSEEIDLLCGSVGPINGLHVYAGSDFQSVDSATQSLVRLNATIPSSDLPVQFGPGLGISYQLTADDPDWKSLVLECERLAQGRILTLEVGRYLVAHCAILLARVQVVKQRGHEVVCILDTGISSFARTLITGAVHPVVNITRPTPNPGSKQFTLCGPTCTPLDIIRAQCAFAEVKEGDILGILSAGAYGFNLSFSGFLGFERAPFETASSALARI